MKEKVKYGYLSLSQDDDYIKRLVAQLQLRQEKAIRSEQTQKAAKELMDKVDAFQKKHGYGKYKK